MARSLVATRWTTGLAELPDGIGSIELESIPRFASLDVHHDPSQLWVLIFAGLVVAGLVTSLFIPRRRVWIKAVTTSDGVTIEYAGLARGDDPALPSAVADLADRHSALIGANGAAQPDEESKA